MEDTARRSRRRARRRTAANGMIALLRSARKMVRRFLTWVRARRRRRLGSSVDAPPRSGSAPRRTSSVAERRGRFRCRVSGRRCDTLRRRCEGGIRPDPCRPASHREARHRARGSRLDRGRGRSSLRLRWSANSGASSRRRSSAALMRPLIVPSGRARCSAISLCDRPSKKASNNASRCAGGSCATAQRALRLVAAATSSADRATRRRARSRRRDRRGAPRAAARGRSPGTGDADEPGAHLCASGFVLGRAPPEGDEDVLSALFGQLPVAEQALGHAEDNRAIALVEHA